MDPELVLGIQISNHSKHFKQLKSALNRRLFVIRRIKRQIPSDKLMTIVHSLWVSKMRYGLQLCTKVNTNADASRSGPMKALQLTQNRMLRAINGSRTRDRISTESLLKKFGLLSVNQLSAQIKLTEVWKSINVRDYPLTLDPYTNPDRTVAIDLRPQTNRTFDDSAKLKISSQSFCIDAAKLWNGAPPSIKTATSLTEAKTLILNFVKSLPI